MVRRTAAPNAPQRVAEGEKQTPQPRPLSGTPRKSSSRFARDEGHSSTDSCTWGRPSGPDPSKADAAKAGALPCP